MPKIWVGRTTLNGEKKGMALPLSNQTKVVGTLLTLHFLFGCGLLEFKVICPNLQYQQRWEIQNKSDIVFAFLSSTN